jgi:hypothetical protein
MSRERCSIEDLAERTYLSAEEFMEIFEFGDGEPATCTDGREHT